MFHAQLQSTKSFLSIESKQICATSGVDGKGACQGDSGSPIQRPLKVIINTGW